MAKLDFTNVDTGNKAAEALEAATGKRQQQRSAGPAEQAARSEALRTQGRKGCKGERLNTMYSPSNISYIKIMAMVNGQSISQFVNDIVTEYREKDQRYARVVEALSADDEASKE